MTLVELKRDMAGVSEGLVTGNSFDHVSPQGWYDCVSLVPKGDNI